MQQQQQKKILVLCSKESGGQQKQGTEEAPDLFLREYASGFLTSQVQKIISDGQPQPTLSERLQQTAAIITAEWSPATQRLLHIGGDHSVAIASISAVLLQQPDSCVIWVDAHCDANTLAASQSGNIHGCPVAFVGGVQSPVDGWSWLLQYPRLPLSRIAYVGLRSVDSFERVEILQKLKVPFATPEDVEREGIEQVVQRLLHEVDPEQNSPIHLSLDVDAVDPIYIPSTGTPVPDGLTAREARSLCLYLHKTERLNSVDLVELNPKIGTPEQVRSSFSAASRIIDACFGRGYV